MFLKDPKPEDILVGDIVTVQILGPGGESDLAVGTARHDRSLDTIELLGRSIRHWDWVTLLAPRAWRVVSIERAMHQPADGQVMFKPVLKDGRAFAFGIALRYRFDAYSNDGGSAFEGRFEWDELESWEPGKVVPL